MEAGCWINASKGRPLKMTGIQDRDSRRRRWGRRLENPRRPKNFFLR